MSGPGRDRADRRTKQAELHRFFDVADRIYAADPNWVAPIRDDLAKVFALENPFFRHAEMQLFLARRGGEDVGRIAAILDRGHNEFHGEQDRVLRLLRVGRTTRPSRARSSMPRRSGRGSGR